MRRPLVFVSAALCVGLVSAAVVRAKKPKPQPCPAGRFLISGAPVIAGDTTSGPREPVVVGSGNLVSIGDACAPAKAKLKAGKIATGVNAGWKSCTGLTGKVKLAAKIDTATCNTMTGKLHAKKFNGAFTATRSRCGDDVVDAGAGEACDSGSGCSATEQCTDRCTCVPLPTTTTTVTTTTGTAPTTTSTTLPPTCGQHPDCGNGVLDPGEECDPAIVGGPACSANCTFPGCGNCSVDPGETCDDGNTVDGDACPSSCVIESCAQNSATSQSVSVHLTTPNGVTVGAITVLLDYPEGQVTAPQTTPGGSGLDSPNDLDYALKDPILDGSLVDGIPANGADAMLQVDFHGCQGQALPVAGDFHCTILDAADENGDSLPLGSLGCNVTIP